jgi:putative sterol carrier protein
VAESRGTVVLTLAWPSGREKVLHWRFDGGRPVADGVGPVEDPDVVLSAAGADADSLLRGEVEPSVAYMRGRLKAAGDGALLLAFLESTAGDGREAWLERLRSLAAGQ